MNFIKSGRYIDIFLCQNMRNNKSKHSGEVSCSACNAFFIYRKRDAKCVIQQIFPCIFIYNTFICDFKENIEKVKR